MAGLSITTQSKLLDATARRCREKFRYVEASLESLGSAPTGPKARHEALRQHLEPKSAYELLHDNPTEAVKGRLRRLGVAQERIESVTSPLESASAAPARRVGLERIINRNELLSVAYLDLGQRAGRAVGRICIRSAGGGLLGFGSGSMISPSLLMTNNHVLDSANRATHSVAEFNYQMSVDGTELTKVAFRLRPDVFFTTSPIEELDLTIVAVDTVPSTASKDPLHSFGFNRLSASRDEILGGKSVTIIQHPNGDLKQIALRENRVLRLPDQGDQFLFYETDTTPGSSGAPVFNDQWEVVAVHHSGFPERNAEGQILTPEGEIWREEMGDDRIHWIANEGIRVVAIRDFLSTLPNLSSEQGRLVQQTLDPMTPQPVATPSGVGENSSNGAPSPGKNQMQVNGETATWNIPLSVSVTLGQPTSNPAITAFDQSSPPDPPVAKPPQPTPLNPSTPRPSVFADDISADDIRSAREELDRAADRPYIDEEKDAKDQKAYYKDISSTLNPGKLFAALSDLVTKTHSRTMGYSPSKHVYPWVDLQPNLKIKSVYSDQEFDPLDLIERDFAVATVRRERMARFFASESAANPAAEAAMLESLEAQLPFNCEHVVPQSWFAKKQPMRGDLHHLFACESKCNSFRSNTPYFDFTDFGEATRTDCGKSIGNKFEPNAGKGAAARATLYFLLRYPGQVNTTANEYTPERLEILLLWHKDHSVTEHERHRNQAIFEVQGNRNPLIDFPELGRRISFLSRLG